MGGGGGAGGLKGIGEGRREEGDAGMGGGGAVRPQLGRCGPATVAPAAPAPRGAVRGGWGVGGCGSGMVPGPLRPMPPPPPPPPPEETILERLWRPVLSGLFGGHVCGHCV